MRVSTEQQAMYGHSLEAQTEKCLKYARANCLTMGEATNCGRAGVFVDAGESARKKTDLSMRPGGQALLQALEPGDHVVVTSPHRLFRSLRASEAQLTDWLDNKIYAHFTDVDVRLDSPNGRLVVQVLGAVAEWNSRIRGDRVREANAWKKLRLSGSMQTYEEFRSRRERATGHSRKPTETVPGGTHLFDQIAADDIEKRLGNTEIDFSGTVRAYIRVSKADQTVENQRQPILDWLGNQPQYAGADLRWYVDEGYSAYSKNFEKRPSGRRLMAELQKGDMVISLRADRICRSMPDMARVIKVIQDAEAAAVVVDCGIRTDTAMGRLMLNLLAFVGQLESQELDLSLNSAVRMSILKKGIHPTTLPAFLTPLSTTKRRKSFGLVRLLTDEEFLELKMYWIFRCREAVANQKPNTKFKGAGIARATYEANIWMAKKVGFPITPRARPDEGVPYTVADAVKDTLKMQEELGFSQRRAELLKFLKGKKSKELYHMFLTSGNILYRYQAAEKWISQCVPEGPISSREVQESHILRFVKTLSKRLSE